MTLSHSYDSNLTVIDTKYFFFHVAQRLNEHCCTTVTEDDSITTENFKTFVDFFALKTRNIAIKSLTEGMTLNGYVQLTSIFSLVPSFLVTKLVFDDPTYDVDKLISRFTPEYCEFVEEEHPLNEMQKRCFRETLPEALRFLSERDDKFLVDFIFNTTGSAYLPNLDMHPNFVFIIEFTFELDNTSIPTATTCERILRLPVLAYDNNVELLCEKLQIAVENGKTAGFGMN